jgi:hypothetical protein
MVQLRRHCKLFSLAGFSLFILFYLLHYDFLVLVKVDVWMENAEKKQKAAGHK